MALLTRSAIIGILGLSLAVFGIISYTTQGFNFLYAGIWLFGIFLVAYTLYVREKSYRVIRIFEKKDFIFLGILFILFIPLYLVRLYDIPWQINTDEVTITQFINDSLEREGKDPLGNSTYFGFPTLTFLVMGYLGKLFGSTDLFAMRMVHALFGIVIVLFSYIFFRAANRNQTFAFAGALLLGFNHSLFAINRMAMWNNPSLLVELAALIFLFIGMRKKSLYYSFIGGIFTGISLYVYYPARTTIFLWALGLLLIILMRWRAPVFQLLFKLSLVCLLGFILIGLPILIGEYKNKNTFTYQREQFLFTDEGQALEMRWTGTDTPKDAIYKNIQNGLLTFNRKITDQGFIYVNNDHGFIDPITGVLLWLGLAVIIFKKRTDGASIIGASSFIALLLLLAFVITKSPNYTRLLVTLPFVIFLAITALEFLSKIIEKTIERLNAPEKIFPIFKANVLFFVSIMFISILNLGIFSEFVKKGFAEGDDVGSTARYVIERKTMPDHAFYLAADKDNPYYNWGEAYQWNTWFGIFVPDTQHYKILPPEFIAEEPLIPPFTIFMNNHVWERYKNDLVTRFPKLKTTPIKTNGDLLAIEVL